MEKSVLKLPVSETFSSIQGEGQTMGVPAVFLRLGGCNLLCKSASWECDSIKVWSKSTATAFEDVLKDEYVSQLRTGAHLVITGGEPMLHQEMIQKYYDWFRSKYGFKPIVEVETNGTILPKSNLEWTGFVSYWNVSAKLSTAGEQNKKEIRINREALQYFSSRGTITIFKFVISSDADVLEVCRDYLPMIRSRQVVLMPAGATQDELSLTRKMVAEHCKHYLFRYSDRLHIVLWNLKTGV